MDESVAVVQSPAPGHFVSTDVVPRLGAFLRQRCLGFLQVGTELAVRLVQRGTRTLGSLKGDGCFVPLNARRIELLAQTRDGPRLLIQRLLQCRKLGLEPLALRIRRRLQCIFFTCQAGLERIHIAHAAAASVVMSTTAVTRQRQQGHGGP